MYPEFMLSPVTPGSQVIYQQLVRLCEGEGGRDHTTSAVYLGTFHTTPAGIHYRQSHSNSSDR